MVGSGGVGRVTSRADVETDGCGEDDVFVSGGDFKELRLKLVPPEPLASPLWVLIFVFLRLKMPMIKRQGRIRITVVAVGGTTRWA